jgi:hypothetical protein
MPLLVVRLFRRRKIVDPVGSHLSLRQPSVVIGYVIQWSLASLIIQIDSWLVTLSSNNNVELKKEHQDSVAGVIDRETSKKEQQQESGQSVGSKCKQFAFR